ncbi:MAG TPA: tRNA(Ile)(2)-agmatinylcytidine synthase [Nitrosopumilaceae archaeon]|nr:tRNA(Ile)(2)-agmatinylcytidine synthase [Nitrosopumilaceae archaeon]
MKTSSVLHIGFDDTDSRNGMCTTFLAYKIVEYLKKEHVKFLDYPYLIRFNPNIPWKTRGNGAVAIKIKTEKPQTIKKNITEFVQKYSSITEGANPGLVFYQQEKIPEHFSKFGQLALCQLINRDKAKKFALENGVESFYLGNGQGLVGAIGAIGYSFDDHTFEFISYRDESNFGKKREIIKDSVRKMQNLTRPRTFNSFDEEKNRVLIAPHGPDPVLFGVRGEDIHSVLKGASLVRSPEKFAGYMVFRSNQGTGAHLKNELDISNLKPFSSGTVIGKIFETPKIEIGGHVIFSITKDGQQIQCIVYKPTGMTQIASKLLKGDLVKIGGGIRKASKNHKRILNVELLEVLELERNLKNVNPLCHDCNKRMKSKGKNQGFECIKCGNTSKHKLLEEIPREIKIRLYVPITSAHRHLTRPLQRIGKSNKKIAFYDSKKWFHVSKSIKNHHPEIKIKSRN